MENAINKLASVTQIQQNILQDKLEVCAAVEPRIDLRAQSRELFMKLFQEFKALSLVLCMDKVEQQLKPKPQVKDWVLADVHAALKHINPDMDEACAFIYRKLSR